MNTLPAIGKGRGLFEIFVPGVFLLINLVGGLYVLPIDRSILTFHPSGGLASVLAGTAFTISFGYLLGVILRVLRANFADRLSAGFLRLYRWRKWRKEGFPPIQLTEEFPFLESLRIMVYKDFPEQAAIFFDQVWANSVSGRGGQAFFNFCKVMVNSEDIRAADEVYSAEALTRYMTSICYALVFSFMVWAVIVVVRLFMAENIYCILLLLLVAYALAIGIILRNLRLLRLKEVQTVFAATFKCRDILFTSKSRE